MVHTREDDWLIMMLIALMPFTYAFVGSYNGTLGHQMNKMQK